MLVVSINGIIQCPGVDYHATNNSISFSTPPGAGSTVSVQSRSGTLTNVYGDGVTFLYQFINDIDHDQIGMLEEAFKLRHVPAVADMLERLEVVVKLAKQE
jgi:hypothetical protein